MFTEYGDPFVNGRDYAEEAYNAHILHTGDGEFDCTISQCPYYVEPTIRCGCCKGRHSTVQAVKNCYADRDAAEAEMMAEAMAERLHMEYLERRAEEGGWFGYGD